nr:MAG TPA: hypothetical protein [Caudoviricetes sp.]
MHSPCIRLRSQDACRRIPHGRELGVSRCGATGAGNDPRPDPWNREWLRSLPPGSLILRRVSAAKRRTHSRPHGPRD